MVAKPPSRSLLDVAAWTPRRLRAFADRYVRETLGRESALRAKELAFKVGMSPSEFSRLFRHVVGEFPSAYLRKKQISLAKYLLRRTSLSMNEIAYRSGFGTRTTFFRAFRRHSGLTPKEYRAQRRNG